MKQLFLTSMAFGCLGLSFAQGLQGKITLSGNVSVRVSGNAVTLTWNASPYAASYNIYRGTTSGGPYIKISSGIVGTVYTDIQVIHNQTFYYVTTAVNGGGESGYSNEAAAVIP
jgi:fibronectin type 3 domain-containing protein